MNGPACESTRSPSCDLAGSPDNDYYDAASFNERSVLGIFGSHADCSKTDYDLSFIMKQ